MRVFRWLGSIRNRFLALLIFVAIPLFGLAATIAAQNYRVVAGQVVQSTLLVLDEAAARHEATIDATALLLSAIGRLPLFPVETPTTCDASLNDLLKQEPGRYSNFALLDAAGNLRCLAHFPDVQVGQVRIGDSFAGTDWFRQVERHPVFTVMAPDHGRLSGVARVVAVQPMLHDGQMQGVVFAALRLDWLSARVAAIPREASRFHLWLINDDGQPIEIAQSLASALPKTDNLPKFLDSIRQTTTTTSRAGETYCYAVTRLGPGLRLLVGHDSARELANARRRLITLAIELGLLLVVGLASVVIGANLAVRKPLAQLTQSISRWQGGATFEAPDVRLPMELRELSAAFAQATASLALHDMRLRRALAEQQSLVQEIHHRVKNNMQIVASLLNLQAARINQPEARAEFQTARDRVRTLATLHRYLYARGELHSINMLDFLNELCTQLFQGFGEVAGERIDLNIAATELQISSDQAVPLALIVTEIVSNAIKYAFPGGRHGMINIALTQIDGHLRLAITDDGAGMAHGVDTSASGIGLQLINGFVRQIGAVLTVTAHSGTGYVIDLPSQVHLAAKDIVEPVG